MVPLGLDRLSLDPTARGLAVQNEGHIVILGTCQDFPHPTTPNVPLLRALWSLLDGIWGILECTWGVLDVALIWVPFLGFKY